MAADLNWAKAHGPWLVLGVTGALVLAGIAVHRGEAVGAPWLVLAAVCVYLVAYRYYSRYLARDVLQLEDARPTPAQRLTDGLDFVPTHRVVLFGHHFAAIAGAGPLVGPILAAQMGYLPGTLWILAGAVLAGAVQDFLILCLSMRRDGGSFGELARSELGACAGTVVLVGAYAIMVIILAVLSLIVVRALAQSPWGLVSVALTIPAAVAMGVYGRWIRPGRVGEVSAIGLLGLMGAIKVGQLVAASPGAAPLFTVSAVTLCHVLLGYAALAAAVPVWILLAPRDYLSTFLKLGAIAALIGAILIERPLLQLPAVTRFVTGGGPIWPGAAFPFLFITIACGAVSGFHALIASGTTPKLIATETDARFIGYGAMLLESLVAVVALISASMLDPGVYFAMNAPAALVGTGVDSAAAAVSQLGFPVGAAALADTARNVGELSIISRSGGAPTLAVAMAELFSRLAGGRAAMPFWYHFAILFEAMFILTAVDAGTRAGRFMLQDLLGTCMPWMKRSGSGRAAMVATALCVASWGFFLYQGVTDPLGGVNTLWPLFGIANQMLACMALLLATVVIARSTRPGAAWVAAAPGAWLLVCTGTAASLKIASPDPRIGFFAHAAAMQQGLRAGILVPPATSASQMARMILNDRIDGLLCAVFLAALSIVVVVVIARCRSFRSAAPSV